MKKFALTLLALCIPLLAGCALLKNRAPGTEADPQAVKPLILSDGTYILNPQASTLTWKAYKLAGSHAGGILLKSGELIVTDGRPQSGSFTIDMTTITNSDLPSESVRTNLVNHLKSDDFFSVADYPTARFDITRVLSYDGDEDYTYKVEGDLSIRDVTDAVTLLVRLDQAGDKVVAYAKTDVDRTQYGINFRSGTFFENLGDALIKDVFTLEMDLVADRVEKSL